MASICVIERKRKVKQAFELLEKYSGLHLEIGCLNSVEYSMEIKHPNYQIVCEFVKELYSEDLVPSD